MFQSCQSLVANSTEFFSGSPGPGGHRDTRLQERQLKSHTKMSSKDYWSCRVLPNAFLMFGEFLHTSLANLGLDSQWRCQGENKAKNDEQCKFSLHGENHAKAPWVFRMF